MGHLGRREFHGWHHERHEHRGSTGAGPVAAAPRAVRFVVNPGTAEVAALNLADLRTSVQDAVATRLGVGTDDVAAASEAGQSLNEQADLTGVGREELLTSIRQALPGTLRSSAVGLALARRIANTTGPLTDQTLALHVTTGGEAATRSIDVTLATTADLLGLSTGDLTGRLARGSSLTDVADAQGVSRTDLLAAVREDLPVDTPGWRDLDTLAAQLVDTIGATPLAESSPLHRRPALTSAAALTSTAALTAVAGWDAAGTAPTVQRFTVNQSLAEATDLSLPQIRAAVYEAVAARLGTGTDDVVSAAAQGTSLADLADITGTGRDDVLATVQQALPGGLATSDVGRLIAERIVASPGALTEDTLTLPLTTGGRAATRTVDLTLDTTAGLLGVSDRDLTGQLARGASLAGLADAAGIDRADLLAAVSADLPAGSASDWDDPDLLAAQIVESGTSAPVEQPTQTFSVNPGVADAAALSLPELQASIHGAVATLMGTGTDDVAAATDAGYSLDDLADLTGTGRDDVLAAIRQALPGDLRTSAVGAELAERIAGTAGPLTADLLTLPPSTGGAAAAQGVQVTLTSTADLLGISAHDLDAKLARGLTLAGLADAAGIDRADLLDAIATDLPADAGGWGDPAALAGQIATGVTTDGPRLPAGPEHYSRAAARYAAA